MPLTPRNNQLPPLKNRKSLSDPSLKDQQEALKHDETQRESLDDNVPSGPDYISSLSDKLLQLLSHRFVSVYLDSGVSNDGFIRKQDLLDSNLIDQGIRVIAKGCLNLRKLVLIGVCKEGLTCVAEKCKTLQELELHCCSDFVLKGISGCQNLQILKLIGCVDGFYDSVISDIGLTILAQGCRRLVKLELVGCEGSFDGIKAVGQCCQMLEEFTLRDHRMDGGWLAALSYCGNLKTLKFRSCKSIDTNPGPDEHLGSCPALEELHLQRFHVQDKEGARALFLACQAVRELVFEDCWDWITSFLEMQAFTGE